MTRKYFPFDKNYLLKEAQAASRDTLLLKLFETTRQCYLEYCNPLGLIDDTIGKILVSTPQNLEAFNEFYEDLAGVYRFKFGEVQLEFLWDGTSHREKYRNEWEDQFINWVRCFCRERVFIRAILELTIFHSPLVRPELVANRLKNFLSNYFELKIYHYKGIMERDQVA